MTIVTDTGELDIMVEAALSEARARRHERMGGTGGMVPAGDLGTGCGPAAGRGGETPGRRGQADVLARCAERGPGHPGELAAELSSLLIEMAQSGRRVELQPVYDAMSLAVATRPGAAAPALAELIELYLTPAVPGR